jgi:ankyrin repeat protein
MQDAASSLNDIIRNSQPNRLGPAKENDWATVLSAIILGGDPNHANLDNPPLTIAAKERYTLLVEALLKLGADADGRDHRYRTSLYYAARNNDIATAECLLKAGARTDLVADGQLSPLHRATTPEMVRLLLRYGADPHAKDCEGRSPVDYARAAGNAALTPLLAPASQRQR